MGFGLFKNTVLFSLLVIVSCGNKDAGKQELADSSTAMKVDSTIVMGADQLNAYLPELKDKRVAVVANQTSVVNKPRSFQSINSNKDNYKEFSLENRFTHLVDTLLAHDVKIVKVFAPEHGFRGKADAGELVEDGIDMKTGLPLLSLHGTHKKPTESQLNDVDIMVFDIQDVGVRFYTYISTLHNIMEACAENDISLIVLDRPNPNGNYIDGPTMKTEHTGFLGMHPIPLIHGMTIGEYAQMINGEKWLADGIQCELKIIKLRHYNYSDFYSLPIKPSPNLPNDQAIKLYPSLGLFEGTNVNAGRGTDYQFQRYGAPFLDSTFYDFKYIPKPNVGATSPKHLNETCYGKDLSDLEVERQFTLKWIMEAYENSVDKSAFFNTKNFTAHAGTEELQQQIEANLDEVEIRKSWEDDLKRFKQIRQKYLLYD